MINSTTWLHNVREVLVVYKGRKRPVVLPNVENAEQINLLNLAKEAFSDVIYWHEGSSSDCTTADPKFFSQMESTKWGGQLIEVTKTASVSISDGAELHLCNEQQPGASSSTVSHLY